MSKSISAKRFCEIYSQFWDGKIDKIEQLTSHKMNGKELHEFCEFYYKEKLDQSSLQHFYSCRKQKYIMIGVCLGVLIENAIVYLIK